MSFESAPQHRDWEGLHGDRQTGEHIVKPYDAQETDEWVESLGLPPRLEDETWQQWAARTQTEAIEGE